MKNLEYLRVKANRYDLVAEYLSEDTLKVYSPKFFFDSWLIKETDEEMELWHMSKKNNLKKCSYHLQSTHPKSNKIRVLQKIKEHNNYVAFRKGKYRMNLVDRVLNSIGA